MIFSNLKFCCKPCTTTREEGQYQNADFVFKKMRTSCLKKCGLWQVGCQRHNPNTVNLPVICYC